LTGCRPAFNRLLSEDRVNT